MNDPINSYIKIYPDKIKIIKYKTSYLPTENTNNLNSRLSSYFVPLEDTIGYETNVDYEINKMLKAEEQIDKSLQRAKTKISDLIDCNPFDMFATFTSNCMSCKQNCKNNPLLTKGKSGCVCDPQTCKRFDVDFQRRNFFAWLLSQKKAHGNFHHLAVMELHKSGAPHFHALFHGYKGRLQEYKADRKDDKMIYNLVEHKRGHTTLKIIPPEEKKLVASYMKKYLTKDMPLFPGRNRYICSKGLLRPITKSNPDDIEMYLDSEDVEIWIPPTEPYKNKRTKRLIIPKPTNIESITTVHLDNNDLYRSELSALGILTEPTSSSIARTAHRALVHLDRISSRKQRGSLAADCPRVGDVELGA